MIVETVLKPICYTCDYIPENIWGGNMITNAWQKHGFNHYEFNCPECETKQVFKIQIEDAPKDEPLGSVMWKMIKGAFFFPVQ